VGIDDYGEHKQRFWKGREVVFHIDNQTNNIILTRGTYTLLKGKEVCNFHSTISPDSQKKMIIKALGILRRGQLHCYLVYELVLRGQERMPIMKNQRAFLAVEVYSEMFSKKCTASAALFTVKSSRFTGDSDGIERLHKDLLQYHIIQDRKTIRSNINGQIVEMIASLKDANPTRINIDLRNIRNHVEYGPVFHRANAFA
jgi:hypothetical protein